MAMLGALIEATGIVATEHMYDCLVKTFKGKYLDRMPLNVTVIERGAAFIRELRNE